MKDFISFFISIILVTIIYIHFENKVKEVEYIKSTIDGKDYLVQNHKDKQEAADLLATIRKNLIMITQELNKTNKDQEDVSRMINNFNPDNITETDKNSKYTSFSINKGEKMVFCLRSRDEKNKLVKLNTMMFVAIHELAHTMTKSIGHTQEFWDNFRTLLKNGRKLGVYERVNYNETPVPYCGIKITDDPENFNE
jgi:predicted metal-dependent hydrolase